MSTRKKTTRGNPARRIVLYHYTHAQHMRSLLESGVIRLTESNVSFARTHAGPDVVWLTDDPDLLGVTSDGLAMVGGGSKAQVRITVGVPEREAHRWTDWIKRQAGSTERDRRALTAAGGSDRWYVVERPIAASDWLAIEPEPEQ